MTITSTQNDHTFKINIIEDDASMRMMLEDYIQEKYPEAEVSCYVSGEEALEKISVLPDMVILDYNLDSINGGVMNGIQVLNKLKEKYPKVPVVFLSGQERSEVAANTMKHGAQDYIIKNDTVFQRLEIALKNNLGHSTHGNSKPFSKALVTTLILMAVALILGIVIWKSKQ